jgi:hypothetical protein
MFYLKYFNQFKLNTQNASSRYESACITHSSYNYSFIHVLIQISTDRDVGSMVKIV